MNIMASVLISSPISFAGDPSNKKIDSSIVDYVDILFNLMGIDITYTKFQGMSELERKQFLRDIKINKIINE